MSMESSKLQRAFLSLIMLSKQSGNLLKMDITVSMIMISKILVSVFCFGHTGAGKSYTMFGSREKSPGIIPLTLESIFAYIYEVIVIVLKQSLESWKWIFDQSLLRWDLQWTNKWLAIT